MGVDNISISAPVEQRRLLPCSHRAILLEGSPRPRDSSTGRDAEHDLSKRDRSCSWYLVAGQTARKIHCGFTFGECPKV